VPFVTGWMERTTSLRCHRRLRRGAALAGVAYLILQRTIIIPRADSVLAAAVGRRGADVGHPVRGDPLAFFHEWISDAIYVLVALMWLVGSADRVGARSA
jgi:hypothetical protein